MFARKGLFSSIGRSAMMATVAAATLTAVEPSMAVAGSAPAGLSAATATSGATDFSARRRYYRGGGGAALGAFAAVVGTGLAIAATRDRDDYYYGGYPAYYGGGPVYYGGGPAYYGGYNGDPGFAGYGYNGDPGYGYRSGVPHYRGHPLAGW
jgi:hypothetical protein